TAAGFMQGLGLGGASWAAALATLGAGLPSLMIPDLPGDRKRRASARHIAMHQMMRRHARVFLTLGLATALVSALRSCRQIVIPLWADQIGLDATTTALIYGLMGSIDMLLFYPAGRIMDIKGRLWVALPSMLIMASSMALMPLTHGFATLMAVSMLLGLGNGIGSG